MAQIRLRRVTLEGFRSFVTKQSTPLLPTSGLLGIRGHNLDTNGSSGAGKSSVIYAICFALGLLKAPYSAAKLKSKWGKASLQVELELEADGVPVVLKRGKVTSIRVGEEPEVSGAVEAVNERLYRLLGLDSDLLAALTFRGQKKPGLFLSMKDAAKKEFLSSLLGLQEVEREIEESTPRANRCKQEAEKVETARNALQGQLRLPEGPVLLDVASLLAELDPLVSELTQAQTKLSEITTAETLLRSQKTEIYKAFVRDQDTEMAAFEVKLQERRAKRPPKPTLADSEMATQLREGLVKCTEKLSATRLEREANLKKTRATRDQAKIELRQIEEFIALGGLTTTEQKKLRAKIEQAEGETCPTCTQTWVAGASATKLAEWKKAEGEAELLLERIKEAKHTELPAKDAAYQAAATVVYELERDHSEEERLTELKAEMERRLGLELGEAKGVLRLYEATIAADEAQIATERTVFLGGIRQARAAKESETKDGLVDLERAKNSCQMDMSRISTLLANAKNNLERAKTQNEVRQAQYAREQNAYHRLSKDIEGLNGLVEEHLKGFARESDLAIALKAFLGSVFDEVLDEISVETNDLLRGLKNVATTTIAFVSDKTTEKGGVKQQIRPLILKGGVEMDWEVDLSGGQGTSLELAVDLAVGKVIGRRTGKMPGWLLLDEAFDGMDLAVKETSLEILQKAAQDRLICIVDHSSELRDAFTGFVDVESSNEISRILA